MYSPEEINIEKIIAFWKEADSTSKIIVPGKASEREINVEDGWGQTPACPITDEK